jgi:hypothetical protein
MARLTPVYLQASHDCRPPTGTYAPPGKVVHCPCGADWIAASGDAWQGLRRRPYLISFAWYAAGGYVVLCLYYFQAPWMAYVLNLMIALVVINASYDWLNRAPRHVLSTRWRRRRWYHQRR